MIEPVGAEACELLASLHARAFDKPWSAAEIAKLLENPSVVVLVENGAGGPRGFIMAWAIAGDAEVLTVAVVPETRRQGVGASLVSAAAAAAVTRGAASMHLEVAEPNVAARALYTKLGFTEAGRRRDYYATEQGWVDAIVMRRALP